MSEGFVVSNTPLSSNPDIPVRGDSDADGNVRQVFRLDVGTGTGESVVSSSNPLPVQSTALETLIQQSELLADLVATMKQIRKHLEPSATQDSLNRQRIVIESLTGINSITGAQNITHVNPVVAGNSPPIVGTYTFQPVWEGPVEQRWRVMDAARTLAYLQRQNLSFS